MARKPKLDFSNIGADRKKTGTNQKDFWTRYGVTQSGGSRYESGRNIPKPLAILLWLHRSGKVSDKDLADALKKCSEPGCIAFLRSGLHLASLVAGAEVIEGRSVGVSDGDAEAVLDSVNIGYKVRLRH